MSESRRGSHEPPHRAHQRRHRIKPLELAKRETVEALALAAGHMAIWKRLEPEGRIYALNNAVSDALHRALCYSYGVPPYGVLEDDDAATD